jgi:hypothetical protein
VISTCPFPPAASIVEGEAESAAAQRLAVGEVTVVVDDEEQAAAEMENNAAITCDQRVRLG